MGYQTIKDLKGDDGIKQLLKDVKATLKIYGHKTVFVNLETKELYYDEFRAKKAGKYREVPAKKVLDAKVWDDILSTGNPANTAKAADTKKADAKKADTGKSKFTIPPVPEKGADGTTEEKK